MKTVLTIICALAVGLMTTAIAVPVHAESSGLISMLTSQLGVTNDQAEGGSGAILGYAKDQLSGDDYSKVTDAMPETEGLIDSAPKKEGGLAGTLGSASSLLGGGDKGKSAAGLAGLAESFSSLGLDSDMIGKFTPVILDYAKSKGGETVSSLLGGVLQGLL
jgi:hypothetical protein